MQYNFPAGLQPANVEQRERFYREEFSTEEIEKRMKRWPEFVPVIDVGTETTRYKPRLKQYKDKLVRVTSFENLNELQDKLVSYAPEDVYYSRTLERSDEIRVNPEQELVFRVSPNEIDCERCERRRKNMDEKWQEYVFCMDCFEQSAYETLHLHGFLERHFTNMTLVFTGRAFHIHVNDEEGYKMDIGDRKELARKVATQFPIDEAITAGDVNLVRLPGTLNGLVSRKVITLDVNDLNSPQHILKHKSVPASFTE